MLKSMDLNHLEEILDFSWQLCGSLSTSTYPIPKTKEDLKQSFLQKLQHEDDQVLMYFKTNQLIGVIALFVETKEQYVKLGTYIKEDLEKIMDEVIAYLKHRYPSYKVHFTILPRTPVTSVMG